MDALIKGFADYLASEFGYSKSTILAYRSDAAAFLGYVARHNPEALKARRFSPEDVLAFLRLEAEAGRRTTTLHRRLASLKVFERYLTESIEGFSPFMPSESDGVIEKIISLGKPPSQPNCLTTEEIARLWNVMLASPKRQAVRDLAFVALMLEWGFSVNLLLSLEIYNVDLKSRKLWVPSLATLGASESGWSLRYSFAPLVRYLAHGRENLSPREGETRLFISQQGRGLSRQSIWHALRRWGEEAEFEAPLTPRLLRNTAVHRLLGNGVPLKTISLALGHLNPLSTHLLVRRLKAYCEGYEVPVLPELSLDDFES